MSLLDEYGHILLLGSGLTILGIASRRRPRSLENRSGEICDPKVRPPIGYQCGQVIGGWTLQPEVEHFSGYGPYLNRQSVDAALARLGFSGGNLAGFQAYMSTVYGRDLRSDGSPDSLTMKALRDAEMMLDRDEWAFPRTAG